MDKLELAIQMSMTFHQGQLDKAGKPYILHPLRVMFAVAEHGEATMIAAVLHDCPEDTALTLHTIERTFGKEIADAVDSVTKRNGEIYRDFVKRSAKNKIGYLVKIADINDNLRPDRMIPELSGMRKRYEMALKILQDSLFDVYPCDCQSDPHHFQCNSIRKAYTQEHLDTISESEIVQNEISDANDRR